MRLAVAPIAGCFRAPDANHACFVQGLQGVASGAIASDYQRLRVEAVCGRLGLTSLSYLWHQPQARAWMHRLTGSCLTLHDLLLYFCSTFGYWHSIVD